MEGCQEVGAQRRFSCPVCHRYKGEDLGKHLRETHGEEAFRRAVLEAKASGLPDAKIGEVFGITFRQLERIIIEAYGVNVSTLRPPKRITSWFPKEFREEMTTIWSYPQRGGWATHHGGYRGNWSPYIPRNVILKYSQPGDLVLDYFVGGGTTAIEAKLLRRRCIARDINPACVAMTKERLNFTPPETLFKEDQLFEPEVSLGDARDLSDIEDNSVDLICAHPPYAGIIRYSSGIEGDLSALDVNDFLGEMRKVARESFRVLKPGGKCAILIGDTRKRKHVIPIGFSLIGVFLETGFQLKELVIKRQHNCKTTGFWRERSIAHNFLLLAHEYLPIFEKPPKEDSRGLSLSLPEFPIGVRSFSPALLEATNLETTSVWVFPKDAYDASLYANVIRRYAPCGPYRLLAIDKESGQGEEASQELLNLLFIRSPVLSEARSRGMVALYLEALERTVKENLPRLVPGGFLVIEARDIRVHRYVEPVGKCITDRLRSIERLRLKEIVVVAREGERPSLQKDHDNLEIVHEYLLIYEASQ